MEGGKSVRGIAWICTMSWSMLVLMRQRKWMIDWEDPPGDREQNDRMITESFRCTSATKTSIILKSPVLPFGTRHTCPCQERAGNVPCARSS
jgi:hypothetical protein